MKIAPKQEILSNSYVSLTPGITIQSSRGAGDCMSKDRQSYLVLLSDKTPLTTQRKGITFNELSFPTFNPFLRQYVCYVYNPIGSQSMLMQPSEAIWPAIHPVRGFCRTGQEQEKLRKYNIYIFYVPHLHIRVLVNYVIIRIPGWPLCRN